MSFFKRKSDGCAPDAKPVIRALFCAMVLLQPIQAQTVDMIVDMTVDMSVEMTAGMPVEMPDEVPRSEIRSLLNWAVHLSRYSSPVEIPQIRFVDHHYLVMRACQARECAVIGWYNDQDIIYLDHSLSKLDSLMERSVVVHEMVHFLQHKSGEFSASCSDNISREREAYEIQRQYFHAYGALSPIRQQHNYC